MIQVGVDGNFKVYEPISTFLKSPEAGLRYCKTMDVNDPYPGPKEVVPRGISLSGPLLDYERWLVNPMTMEVSMGKPGDTYETKHPFQDLKVQPSTGYLSSPRMSTHSAE